MKNELVNLLRERVSVLSTAYGSPGILDQSLHIRAATSIEGQQAEIERLRDQVRRLTSDRDEYFNALQHIDALVRPGEDFYSWQRIWQTVARLVLGMPEDSTIEDLRLAIALRNENAAGEQL